MAREDITALVGGSLGFDAVGERGAGRDVEDRRYRCRERDPEHHGRREPESRV